MKSSAIKSEFTAFFDKKLIFINVLLVALGLLMMKIGPPSSLDTKLYYSGSEARALLTSFNDAQLSAYLTNEFLDLGFIVTYTCALLIALRRLYPKRRWATVLPMLIGAADLIETSMIIAVLGISFSQSVFDWLGVVTFLKWSFAAVGVTLLLVGLARKWFAMRSKH